MNQDISSMKSYHGLFMKLVLFFLLFLNSGLLASPTQESSVVVKELIEAQPAKAPEKKIYLVARILSKSIPFFMLIGSIYYNLIRGLQRSSVLMQPDQVLRNELRNIYLDNPSELARAIDLSFAAYLSPSREVNLNQFEEDLQKKIMLICRSSVPGALKVNDILSKFFDKYKYFFECISLQDKDHLLFLAKGNVQQRIKFEKIVGEQFLSSLVFYVFFKYLESKGSDICQNKNFSKLIPALNYLFEANIFSIFNYEYLSDYLLWSTDGLLSKQSLISLLGNKDIIWRDCGHWQLKNAAPSECKSCNKDTCSICLELSPNWQTAKCSHKFHLGCIYRWASSNSTCPICRKTLR